MNGNDFAKQICEMEGGKVNLSIAQVKEVLKCVKVIFKHYPIEVLRYFSKR